MTNIDNIPQALRDCKGWLLWKFVQTEQNKKPLKIPHYAGTKKWRKGHAHGSREDRQQLVDFDKAVEVLGKGRKFNGLGFAMLSDWNMVAADFDDCVDENGKVHPMVAELVAPTYWEFSPSGKGIRAFFSGSMRDAKLITKRAKDVGLEFGIEFFNSKGFVTVTGDVCPEIELLGAEIVPVTDALRKFFDEYFGGRNVSTKNDSQPPVGATDEEIVKMLEQWDPTCDYDIWLNVGMAIHHETDGAGFDIWHDWSAQGANYESFEECQYKWESFGRGGKKSVKTLRWMLHEKPIDFSFENVGNDFTPLPRKKDAAGNVVRPAPHFFGIKESGEIPSTAQNMKVAVERGDIFGWEFKEDTFLQRILIQPYGAEDEWRELHDTDFFNMQVRLNEMLFANPSKEKTRDVVYSAARDNAFDSAIHWLTEIVPAWDGVERIANYANDVLNATDDEEYLRAVSLYAWTAHAGRVLDPGCEAQMMPVLIGDQNVGKSTSVKNISPGKRYFTELSFHDDDKKNIEKTIGVLVVECAELVGLNGRDGNAIKDYITREKERYRFPYDRQTVDLPRRFIIWGTTNDERFLSDPTGNRRYLPLHVRRGRILSVEEKLQHWAEARELWKKNGIMCVEEANEMAEPYRESARIIDPWQDTIEAALFETKNNDGVLYGDLDFIKSQEVWRDLLGVNDSSMNSATSRRMAAVMRAIGYAPHKGTKGIRGWRRPIGSEEDAGGLL